jgi:hypothetical protein
VIAKKALTIILAVCLAMTQVACSSSWIQTAINDVPAVLQIVQSVLSIVALAQQKGGVDPAVASTVRQLAAQATADLQLAQQLVADYQAAAAADKPAVLGKVRAALQAAVTDLNGILSAAHIKDANTQAAIATGLQLALTTVVAILALVPQSPVVAGAKQAKPVSAKPPSPQALRKAWNASAVRYGYAQFAIR